MHHQWPYCQIWSEGNQTSSKLVTLGLGLPYLGEESDMTKCFRILMCDRFRTPKSLLNYWGGNIEAYCLPVCREILTKETDLDTLIIRTPQFIKLGNPKAAAHVAVRPSVLVTVKH